MYTSVKSNIARPIHKYVHFCIKLCVISTHMYSSLSFMAMEKFVCSEGPSAFLEYPDKQTYNSTTLHTHCTAKHNYRTAQHNYICFLVIRVETHPFLLQLNPMLKKSGDSSHCIGVKYGARVLHQI